jgi:hypothetical protein
VQYEPGSQSRSRWHEGVEQCPEVVSQVSGAVQPALAQPGTQAPAEQMVAGAFGHSESLLQLTPPSGGTGQPGSSASQQRPFSGLQAKPAAHGLSVQPATQVWIEGSHTEAGGSHMESSVHGAPPVHSPVAGSQLAPLTQAF